MPDALDFQDSIGVERKAARLRFLRDAWVAPARAIDGIDILTPDDPDLVGAITSFRLRGDGSRAGNQAMVRALLEKHRLFTVHRDGVAGGDCVRITPSLYSTPADAARLVSALADLAASRGRSRDQGDEATSQDMSSHAPKVTSQLTSVVTSDNVARQVVAATDWTDRFHSTTDQLCRSSYMNKSLGLVATVLLFVGSAGCDITPPTLGGPGRAPVGILTVDICGALQESLDIPPPDTCILLDQTERDALLDAFQYEHFRSGHPYFSQFQGQYAALVSVGPALARGTHSEPTIAGLTAFSPSGTYGVWFEDAVVAGSVGASARIRIMLHEMAHAAWGASDAYADAAADYCAGGPTLPSGWPQPA